VLTLGTTVLGVGSVPRATAFWAAALGYVPREPGDETFVVLVPGAGAEGARLALMRSETPPQPRPRTHLDLYADDQAAEVDRLVALGASRVEWDSYPPDPDFVVLADPDGNVFCVIDKSGT
jgi:catechol 2,3-dioxygenase-like lactoylglutathione lyase family enzyme